MEEKRYQQCAGPGCTNLIEQVSTGRGHRQRLYCHKNCCMAAIRERQRLAALEAERQQKAELLRLEKEALRKRFGGISEESIDLLYQSLSVAWISALRCGDWSIFIHPGSGSPGPARK